MPWGPPGCDKRSEAPFIDGGGARSEMIKALPSAEAKIHEIYLFQRSQ